MATGINAGAENNKKTSHFISSKPNAIFKTETSQYANVSVQDWVYLDTYLIPNDSNV